MILQNQLYLKVFILSISFIFIFNSCESQSQNIDKEQKTLNDFKAETYVCYQISDDIQIDGRDNESAWQSALWTKSFVDIEGDKKPLPAYNTKVKMLWDSTYFYVFAKMEEAHIWASLQDRDDIIFQDDDFEIFIDPDGDSHNYYELEWNAFNTLWDLILLRPYRVDQKPKVLFEWNVSDIKSAVHIEGSINDNTDIDKFWSIEIAIPWFALNELAPQENHPTDGDQWRINFSRVDWTMENNANGYQKKRDQNGNSLPENNWVWSPTGKVNMHMPEMWGYVQFSENDPGLNTPFIHHPDEQIKWALWQLYWQQLDFYEENARYTADNNDFDIPKLEGCTFVPKFYISPFSFEITSRSCQENGEWLINRDGKIELFRSK